MSYDRDIEQAALSNPCFDRSNIEEIADYYGEDYSTVLKDIEDCRAAKAILNSIKWSLKC